MAFEYTVVHKISGEEIPYQMAWDPSLLATGMNPIGTEWTSRTSTQWASSSIQEIASPLGSKIWRRSYPSGTAGHCINAWANVPKAENNTEILTLQRFSGAPFGIGNISRLNLSGNVQGYFWGFRNNTTEFRGRRWVNGAETLTTTFFHEFGDPANRWFWIRTQSNNNVHKLKIWEYGTAEPVSWQIEYTDTSADASLLTAGYVGEGDYLVAGTVSDIAFVSAGFRGAAAPMSITEVPLQIYVTAVESDGPRYSMTGTLSDFGEIYAVATLPNTGVPSKDQILAGQDASGVAAKGIGSQLNVTNFNFHIEGAGLADNPSHQLHAVARRLSSN